MKSTRHLLVAAILTAVIIIFSACDNGTSDKTKVFTQYFRISPPTNVVITTATNWEAGSIGVDEWELLLEAKLPSEFLSSMLPLVPDGPLVIGNNPMSYLGDTNVSRGIARALEDSPTWFAPSQKANYSVGTNQVGCQIIQDTSWLLS